MGCLKIHRKPPYREQWQSRTVLNISIRHGGVTVLFIEVKLELGNQTERLNFFAQVIAESDCIVQWAFKLGTDWYFTACDFVNYRNGYSIPILGILCDGKEFHFFEFSRQYNEKLRFSLGILPNGISSIEIQGLGLEPVGSRLGCLTSPKQIRAVLILFFLEDIKLALKRIGIAVWIRPRQKVKNETRHRDDIMLWPWLEGPLMKVVLLGNSTK
jgi:hypothetical protein